MAVGALADKLEGEFLKYMPHFQEYLHAGLRNYEDQQVTALVVWLRGGQCGVVFWGEENGRAQVFCAHPSASFTLLFFLHLPRDTLDSTDPPTPT